MSVPEICMSVGLPSTVGDGEVLEGDRRRGLESIADCLLERRPLSSGGAWRDGAQGAAARLLDDHALARHHDAALDDATGVVNIVSASSEGLYRTTSASAPGAR